MSSRASRVRGHALRVCVCAHVLKPCAYWPYTHMHTGVSMYSIGAHMLKRQNDATAAACRDEGKHVAHNKDTGDNVGPLIVEKSA
eukprot:363384-Chlamydomonas_euryale.AAC.4